MLIIGVFDPLAVSLTIATNIAWRQRNISRGKITPSIEQGIIKENMLDREYASTDFNNDDLNAQIESLKNMIAESNNKEDINNLRTIIDNIDSQIKQSNLKASLKDIVKK